LFSPDPGGVTGFGIRAVPTVGKPCYWSMLSLVFVKTILKMKSICENSSMLLFLLIQFRSNSGLSYLVLILEKF